MTDFYSITPGDYYAFKTFDSGTTWNGNGAIDSTGFQLGKNMRYTTTAVSRLA